jgi:hypothetical protein
MKRKKPHAVSRGPSPPAASQGARPPVAGTGARPPVAALSLRPWLLGGMTALLVARPLFPSESAASYGDGMTMVMLWIALSVFWLLGAAGRPEFSLRFGWTDAMVLLLVLWHTAAALWAAGHGTPRPALNMLWEWVGMGLCFFLARQLIVTPREGRAVVAVMVALAVAVAGFGLYKRAYELPQTRAKYAADPDRALRDNGLLFPPNSPVRKLFEDRLANTEPTAAFALTNSLAGFLAPWLVVLAGIGVGIAGGDSSRRLNSDQAHFGDWSRLLQYRRLWGVILCLVPIAVCLAWTKSRSGYAGACVGLLMAWWLGRRRGKKGTVPDQPSVGARRNGPKGAAHKWGRSPFSRLRIGWKLPAAAVGVVVLLGAAAIMVEGPAVLGRASKSFGYRVQYWQSSLRMIADRPWLGCGPGNFQEVYTRYKLPEASEEIADPHNFLLEIWATAGTPAALAFLAVLGCFAWNMATGEGRGPGDKSQIPNPKSQIFDSPDAWLPVLVGGAVGFLLSVPLGMLSAAPPGIAPVLLGLPLAAATVAALFGWIREGRLPRWLPAVGVVVLLVDLSAAGGIGLPGVAGTFWLLLALGLQQPAGGDSSRRWPCEGGEIRRLESPRTWTAWIALAGAIALIAACYSTAYRPVVECQTQLRMADRTPAGAVEHLEAAAAADPLAAEPWQRLAAARFEAWRHAPSREAFDRFEQADAEAHRLAPNSAAAWAASGDWYSQAFSASQPHGQQTTGGLIDKTVAAYARAVQLYPNSATDMAKLAEAHAAAGDQTAFRREAEAALRLDAATPHADKKLPAKLREKLARALAKAP